MPVTEDRKKSRILPNLLIEKVGKQTMVGLDLTAILSEIWEAEIQGES